MDQKELEAVLESVLFAAGDPVSVEKLCSGLGVVQDDLDAAAQNLMSRYCNERRGLRLIQLEQSYQLCTAPEYARYISKTLETRKAARLSTPALETLTIIAYFQPVTRAYVDQLRGVDSAYTISLLLERELIQECGRLAVPGRPILYQTTPSFLRTFGISDLNELPKLPETSEESQRMVQQMERAVARLREEGT